MTENVLSPFLKQAAAQPNKLAIIDGDNRQISYGELDKKSQALATYFSRAGLQSGHRVLLALSVTLDLYVTIAALWRLGAVIVFPEPALGLSGLKHAVSIAEPDAVVTAGKYRLLPWISRSVRQIKRNITLPKSYPDAVHEIYTNQKNDAALISFTSGSTGTPKAIIRSHKFLLAQNKFLMPLIGQAEEDDIDLVVFPIFVIANLAMGLTSVLPNWPLSQHARVSSENIQGLIKARNITRLLVPPVICETLSKASNPPSLRVIFTGGGPVFPDLLKRLAQNFPTADIVSVYGSTEAEPIAHQHLKDIPANVFDKMKTGHGLFAGHPVKDIDIDILDDEIIVAGEHVNKGYMNGVGDAENKLKRGKQVWHRTGDAGHIDEDGHLWLRGRLNAKASDFYPFEIEVAARQWDGVVQAALIPNSTPPTLALIGDEPETDAWKIHAAQFGELKIIKLNTLPMDKRHRSKIDYTALKQMNLQS